MNLSLLPFVALLVILSGGIQSSFTHPRLLYTHPQDQKCPTITIVCPNFASSKDEPLIFIVTVSEVEKYRKVEYEWTVSRGKIKTGQGTPSITVEVKRDGTGIGATAKVKGLPEGCSSEVGNYITHY